MRILIALLFFLPGAAMAKHWCDRADLSGLNKTEKAICATPLLKDIDIEMETVFYALRDTLSNDRRQRLVDEQRLSWLPYRNACDRDRQCMLTRYVERIAELRAWGRPPSSVTPAKNTTITPEGYIFDQTPGVLAPYYSPEKACWGRFIDGNHVCFVIKSQTNPLVEPTLGSESLGWAQHVNGLTLRIIGNLVSEDATSFLISSAPADEAKKIAYYLNALIAIRGY